MFKLMVVQVILFSGIDSLVTILKEIKKERLILERDQGFIEAPLPLMAPTKENTTSLMLALAMRKKR